MSKLRILKSALIGGASAVVLTTAAFAHDFNIPAGDLGAALNAFTTQAGVALVVSGDAVRGIRTHGATGDLSSQAALSRILADTGFKAQSDLGVIAIVRSNTSEQPDVLSARLTQTTPVRVAATATSAGIESVVVTSSKIKGDIQTVPIAITALSQEQLTSRQIAGGPDLVKEVPNLTFSKTNFTGYNIQIRGIGTQAISVTTDPAVAVALNDMPFIRNHFFEQEFYDVSQVEVLRGPQGTLYGRNATAGVVNVITAKPTDQFEAMLSADWGNYTNRRYEGMINVPVVDDRLDIRVAGEWTKRDGYSVNEITGSPIDGRDLWSGRVSITFKPSSNLQSTLVWEHFSEDDDRMRTAKQLCKTAPIALGITVGALQDYAAPGRFLSQGCEMTSLYSPDAFEVPNGYTLTFYAPLTGLGAPIVGGDPYASTTQSRNLRVIESAINPVYKAKNDTLELNTDYAVTPALTLTSQTGYNQDFLWSTEDYNRFNSKPGVFLHTYPDFSTTDITLPDPAAGQNGIPAGAGIFCDPQLGCSDRLVLQDLSDEHAWQLSQEFRLTSNFSGPFNFSIGGNFLHYETEENYYVFVNSLTLLTRIGDSNTYGSSTLPDNSECILGGFRYSNPSNQQSIFACKYIDPNPITSLNNEGHNYFLSQNPYTLNSYAGFGEVYYNIASDLKLTGGLRWTDDQKHFVDIPSELVVAGYGYPISGVVNQQWDQWTGRAAANWTPKLDFTDQTLMYASYAHGYKAGGANPPGAVFPTAQGPGFAAGFVTDPIHPLTFKPEFIDAYELGSKNTLLDGGLTLNGDVFFYNYKGYQISRIVDRTAINDNFNATVRGAELEASWEPAPGLKFNFAGGYEGTRIDNGQSSVDLMDRTANNPDWVVVKPFLTGASNCILPAYVVLADVTLRHNLSDACDYAYNLHIDPVTNLPYVQNPAVVSSGPGRGNQTISPLPPEIAGYPGFDPTQPAINNGQGFAKNVGGNQLPNAPHFTTALSGEYTLPVSADWAATLHSDFYWQSQSMARVFNDRPYDKIRGYSTTNLALILTSASGWQVMGYLKNVFNVTAITGDFLNSDDSGLTTNVFLTDPRLYGVRVTKNF